MTGGTLVRGAPGAEVDHYEIDSRNPMREGATMFVALRGANFDGHDFLEEVSANATYALVDRVHADSEAEFEGVVAVDDTLAALQAIAAEWRRRFGGQVVGITGSNGKTIVKEMVAAIVGRDRTTYRSPGSFNSQVGVPLSVLGIRDEHLVAVIEAGISEPGEMQLLEPIIAPDIGIFTNVGEAHAAGFGDLETTAAEKSKLFARLNGPLIWNGDDEQLRHLYAESGLRFGESKDADYRIGSVEPDGEGFRFSLRFPTGEDHEFRLGVPGRHNVWNAAAAIACADTLGVPVETIRDGLADFELSPMRMEMATTQGGVTLLNDAYSSDPVSAAAALNALVHYAAGQRTIAILGDMLDLGASTESAHSELGALVARLGIDHLVCVGPLARTAGHSAVAHGFPFSRLWEANEQDELNELLSEIVKPGDYVLFKGSRAVGLERAAQSLLESVAPARLYVDLAAIRENVQAIRRRISHDTSVMAVVKSFGYGNDSNRVALTLVRAGVDAFMVAYPDEAIPLRRRGIDVPILVSNVRGSEADKIAKYDLTALVFNTSVLEALESEAARRQSTVPVQVEVDTGMNRLGLEPDDVVEFCDRIASYPHLRFDGLMTHFAAADDPQEDEFTRGQIAAFEHVLADVRSAGHEIRVVHAANTAAAWRFPEARYDMVRIGLGLYGVHPSDEVGQETEGVQPALEFVTEIIAVRTVTDGESVSYGRTWRADGDRRIATIAVGYNDGFPRYMSNGGEVLVRGQRCPVVGNVCMDATMVDVTEVTDATTGDEVVLFGTRGDQTVTIEEIARRGGTINYEILTSVSPRVRRIFRK